MKPKGYPPDPDPDTLNDLRAQSALEKPPKDKTKPKNKTKPKDKTKPPPDPGPLYVDTQPPQSHR